MDSTNIATLSPTGYLHETREAYEEEPVARTDEGLAPRDEPRVTALSGLSIDRITLTMEARFFWTEEQMTAEAEETDSNDDVETASRVEGETYVIRLVVEQMTGRKIRLLEVSDPESDGGHHEPHEAEEAEDSDVEGRRTTLYYESRTVTFEATGTIRTADGGEIGFSVGLVMESEFLSVGTQVLSEGNGFVSNPIVMDFDGTADDLTDKEFIFDADSDDRGEVGVPAGRGAGFISFHTRDDVGVDVQGLLSGRAVGKDAAFSGVHNGWMGRSGSILKRLLAWMHAIGGDDRLRTPYDTDAKAAGPGTEKTGLLTKGDDETPGARITGIGVYVSGTRITYTSRQVDLAV